jgi:L-asparaginase II
MAAHPELVLGPGRLSTVIMEIVRGAVIVKGGAEAVFLAAIPDRGLGLALKIDDGSQRAADVALLAILDQLGVLAPEQARALSDRMAPVLKNASGTRIGAIRSSLGSNGVSAPIGSIRALSRTPW